MQDLKTSILVNRQLPEFIRDEYPLFIKFLEAYYEFLETEQVGETTDLINVSKELRYLPDVDASLERFEDGFYNTFLSFIPQDVIIDKATLIKNILPLYQAKGSEKSFELIFMLLFGEKVDVKYPKDQILIASGGKWNQNYILRVSLIVLSEYIGNGIDRDFILCQMVYPEDISVYVDDLLTTDFYVIRESKKIRFNSPPLENQSIKIYYNNFDATSLINREIRGLSSGASCLVEDIISKRLTNNPFREFYINERTLVGNFINGEEITSDIINGSDVINVRMRLVSDISNITITNGGASYNVGDPVVIRGISSKSATAVVSEVASGNVENIVIVKGGSGFQVGSNVEAVGYSKDFFDAQIQTVNSLGIETLNTVTVYTDTIEDYINTTINSVDYNFPKAGIENVNTSIANALTTITLSDLGEITTIVVNSSSLQADQYTNYEFNALSPIINNSNSNNIIRLSSLGIIGGLNIVNPGTGYEVGDNLIFDYITTDAYGRDASAFISEVGSGGEVLKVSITNGGFLHSSLSFPIISISSSNGLNSVIEVISILGDDEYIEGSIGEYLAGQILNISVLDPGEGYLTVPAIDLTDFGNGLATANVDIQPSYIKKDGKWSGEYGFISSENIKLEGQDYYINYSYVLSSKVEFSKYKDVFKRFIHPAGTVSYNEYKRINDVLYSSNTFVVKDFLKSGISGTVNVNSSVYIIGTNTFFKVAQNNSVINVGVQVSVNSQIRTINTIVSNNVITVTEPFTFTSNNNKLIIIE